MGLSDGVLTGFIKCAGDDNHSHEVTIFGSPMELIQVCRILGLQPQGEPDEKTGAMVVSGDAGYCTMRPVSRASEIIYAHAQAQRGFDPPF